MSTWPCRLLPEAPWQSRPGDMWFATAVTELQQFTQRFLLSDWYFRHNASHRLPIIVCLPDGSEWCVDSRTDYLLGINDRWTVSGIPPRLTVVPSIRMLTWHGTLTDGVLYTL